MHALKKGYRFKDDWTPENQEYIFQNYKEAVTIPVNMEIEGDHMVLNLEKVKHILKKASLISLMDCGCRTMYHNCDAPLNVCLDMNEVAERHINMGWAREVTLYEALSARAHTIKRAVIDLTSNMLLNRKREFTVRPYILFVFDEAQEFLSAPSKLSGLDKECSEEVERLLRQGRKYGLGGCIATQRIAYLNTNALQQLHSYFVSTLPRPYDRGVISNTFMIDRSILEKTLEFVPGEWLVSSYLATGMANVPIFVKADNAEEEVEAYLEEV